ncbi:MAG: hypothetical protein GY820_38915 [Gammaproteobacteria bacterium]|nr:hypothetical protein [Gammaproteobacteria bacterium]
MARTLIGVADSELARLEMEIDARPKPLGRGNEGWRTVKGDGYVIECYSGFGQLSVKISTFPPAPQDEYREERECYCTCHFARGVVLGVEKIPCCYDFLKTDTVYDVEVCTKDPGYTYILLENVPSIDFAPIEIDQKVLIVWTSSDPEDEYENEGKCTIEDSCMITSIPLKVDHKDEHMYIRKYY